MRALSSFRMFLLALWLGAALFFSATVAPIVFAVLRGYGLANANEMAGAIVTRSLAIVNTGGFGIGVLLLLSAFLFRERVGRFFFAAELILLALFTALTGVGQWVIAARMVALRLSMGTIDQVPASDTRRIAFDHLHGYSVTALGIAMIAALIAFVLMARRRQG